MTPQEKVEWARKVLRAEMHRMALSEVTSALGDDQKLLNASDLSRMADDVIKGPMGSNIRTKAKKKLLSEAAIILATIGQLKEEA